MKKVILILLLLSFVLQAQAKEMSTPKLFVNVDRACVALTYTDNTIPAVYECFRKELSNPFNYLSGWSKYVIADIKLKPIGDAIERYPIKTTTKQSEEIAGKVARPVLDKIFEMAIEEINKQPGATTVIPANKLGEIMRY